MARVSDGNGPLVSSGGEDEVVPMDSGLGASLEQKMRRKGQLED